MTFSRYLAEIASTKELIDSHLDRLDLADVVDNTQTGTTEDGRHLGAIDIVAGNDVLQALSDLRAMQAPQTSRTLPAVRGLIERDKAT